VASTESSDPIFVRSSRNTLDLRGQRVDEGIAALERFVDEAYLEHLSPLMVIHGHCTGAKKSAVRDFLSSCSYKNKSRPGENYEGGDGVTVINFK
jgi:DNA mismatch repair protein MutS2